MEKAHRGCNLGAEMRVYGYIKCIIFRMILKEYGTVENRYYYVSSVKFAMYTRRFHVCIKPESTAYGWEPDGGVTRILFSNSNMNKTLD